MNQSALSGVDLADELIRQSRSDEARAICRELLEINPHNMEALFLLGVCASSREDWDEAIDCFRMAGEICPEIALLQCNLGVALMSSGRNDDALEVFNRSIHMDEKYVAAHYNKGVLLQQMRKFQDAGDCFERVLGIDSKHVNAWVNLSAVKLETGDAAGALHCCNHALHLSCGNQNALGNRAAAYANLFRFNDAMHAYEQFIETLSDRGERAEAVGRYANLLSDMGMVDQGICSFSDAIETSPDVFQKRALESTRLFVLHYSSRWTPEAIAAEHFRWGSEYFRIPMRKFFRNDRDPDRPLRVAYISPDLKIHAVVFFLQPVLAAHNRDSMQVYCYSDVAKPDTVTLQLQERHGVVWRDIAGLDDDAVENMIQEDRIDILVELAGHSAGNRLPLCARKVAPVQISWIGYPDSTGLTAIDYRISDFETDPPGMTEHLHTEKLYRLPDTFSCYGPGGDFPPVSDLPFAHNGYVTYGTMSNFKKVTGEQLKLWARILSRVSGSRFVFRARGMTDARFDETIAPLFSEFGVDPARVTVLGHARSVVSQLEDYSRIDIALDTYPYCGTTTTCESLYMGVPVITLAGRSHVSRVGVSFLKAVGLKGLIAHKPEEYLDIAVSLAGDTDSLAILREQLRDRFMKSPLTDNVAFTRNLEDAYRFMWREWCAVNA